MTFIATGLMAWWQIFLTHTETEHAEDVSRTAPLTARALKCILHCTIAHQCKAKHSAFGPPKRIRPDGDRERCEIYSLFSFASERMRSGVAAPPDGQLSREM